VPHWPLLLLENDSGVTAAEPNHPSSEKLLVGIFIFVSVFIIVNVNIISVVNRFIILSWSSL
jgi:hypothetical protein